MNPLEYVIFSLTKYTYFIFLALMQCMFAACITLLKKLSVMDGQGLKTRTWSYGNINTISLSAFRSFYI